MTMKNISGYICKLSNGRSVFVGMSDEDGDNCRYVSLINAEKVETRFRLSKDAASALATLLVQFPNATDG